MYLVSGKTREHRQEQRQESKQFNMLRKVTFRNFVHFQEEQTFEFKEGPYFFIGENRSGKSCTFEAVRRCMSTSKNLYMSTIHDIDHPSCIICEYASNHTDDGQPMSIYSCVVSFEDGNKKCSNKIAVKAVIEKAKENKFFVDLVKENRHGLPVNKMFPINDTTLQMLNQMLENGISTESFIAFVRREIRNTEAYRSLISHIVEINKVEETDCENYLRETIDRAVVITQPTRSVSVAQWSNSPKFNIFSRMTEEDDTFLYEMRFNSDIIAWYLGNQTISKEEKKAVEDIFKVLTDSCRLSFKKDGRVLQVIDNGDTVSLEKAPEGFLEAMICAILLSVKQFKTLCLEEPGKGMHTQMIERLRDLALKKGQNKRIIMITHVPAFLNTCTMERIFFFRRSSDENNPRRSLFRAIHGNDLVPKDETKSRKISADYSLLAIFSASRVLFVEGRSDEEFISAVKSILLDDSGLANAVLQSVNSDLDVDALYWFLTSIQVLPLNGQRNKLRFENLCKGLAVKRYFILDYDAMFDNGNTSKFFYDFALEDLEVEFNQVGVTVLESRGLFVWAKPAPGSKHPNQKGGTIEDAMIELVNFAGEDLKTLFIENNADLNWNFEKNVKRKLFQSKKITHENIDAVVKEIIEACRRHTDCDVFRLMQFLIRSAAGQT